MNVLALRNKLAQISKQHAPTAASKEQPVSILEEKHDFTIETYLEEFFRGNGSILIEYLDILTICNLLETELYPNNYNIMQKIQRVNYVNKYYNDLQLRTIVSNQWSSKIRASLSNRYQIQRFRPLYTNLYMIEYKLSKKYDATSNNHSLKLCIIGSIMRHSYYCKRFQIGSFSNYLKSINVNDINNDFKNMLNIIENDIKNNFLHLECSNYDQNCKFTGRMYGPFIYLKSMLIDCSRKPFTQYIDITSNSMYNTLYQLFIPPIAQIQFWYLVEGTVEDYANNDFDKLLGTSDFVNIIGISKDDNNKIYKFSIFEGLYWCVRY